MLALLARPTDFGELVFWYGLLLGGLPSFGTSVVAYVCSALGISGITFIMLGAAKRLEGKQSEKWGETDEYDEYVTTSGALWPKPPPSYYENNVLRTCWPFALFMP